MPKFSQARFVGDIKPGDSDLYAVGLDGQMLQKRIKFDTGGKVEHTDWIPFEGGGFCQSPSDEYLKLLNDCDNDPRIVAGSRKARRWWGGNPEERA